MSKQEGSDTVKYEEIEKLIDSFAKEVTTTSTLEKGSTKDTKVKKFFDKLLSTLETQKYLTKDEVAKIKQDQNYQKAVGEIVDAIDQSKVGSMIGVERVNKIYYRVARFTKEIGLSEISDYFIQKIPKEQLSALSRVTNEISKEIKSTTGKLPHKNLSKLSKSMIEKMNNSQPRGWGR